MKAKLILSAIIIILLGIAGYFFLNNSPYYFSLYPIIPAFYLIILIGSYLTLLIIKKKKTNIDFKTYAIIRGIKFTLCLIFVILYLKLVAINNIAFVMAFMIFYVVYLILESWLFVKMSKE